MLLSKATPKMIYYQEIQAEHTESIMSDVNLVLSL